MRAQLATLGQRAKSSRILTNALRYQPDGYSEAWQAILAMESADSVARRQLQDDLLYRTLGWAQETAFGRQYGNDLSEWPVLTKDVVRANPQNFTTPSIWAVPATTGGTSGTPLKLFRSVKSFACEQAFLDYLLQPFGYSFRTARVAVFRGDVNCQIDETSPPFWKYRDKNWCTFSVNCLNKQNFLHFAEELDAFRPEILWVYPSYGDLLARLYHEHGMKLPVPLVLSSSEMLFPGAWQQIREVFGCRIVDYYGQAERVGLSYQTAPEQAWFLPAYAKVELHPIPSSDPRYGEANIIGTGFWNEKMPLVRYQTGDRIWYPSHYTERDLEQVALGLKPFNRVIGRDVEYIVSPQGEKVYGLCNLPKGLNNILRLQVIQHAPEDVELRIMPTPSYGEVDSRQLMANARERIPGNMRIHVRTQATFERTAANKTPFVIRKV